MFYLLCFGDNCFSAFDFDEQSHAERCAEKWISDGRFLRCVVCESLCECFLKDEDAEE